MMFLWVGLAIRPFLRRNDENLFAQSLISNSKPMNSPFPLNYFIRLLTSIVFNLLMRYSPITAEF